MNKTIRTFSLAAAVLAGAGAYAAVHYEMGATRVAENKATLANTSRMARKVSEQIRPFENQGNLITPGPRKAAPVFKNDIPVIYGSLLMSYADWFIVDNSYQEGYYAFQPESPLKIQPIAIHPNLYVNGGGAYSDRKIHYHLWEMYADETSETGITFHNYYVVVNTDTWSIEKVVDYSDYQDNISYDMAYDPTTQNLYSFQWGPYETSYCDFAVIDKMSGEASVIAKVPSMVALACDNFGTLFSIGADGYSYNIDKSTGDLIRLGYTGVNPRYLQSATVDPETNDIYWAASTENDGALYKLNTHTGAAELVSVMPAAEQFTALFIEAERKGLDAPAALENVVVKYAEGKSSIQCKIPTKSFDGKALSGDITVKAYIDGKEAAAGKGTPGSELTLTAPVAEGEHTIVISAYNEKGEGPKTIRNQWTGHDVPAAPLNVTFTLSGQQAKLVWDAPLEGLHGGTIEQSELTYTVTRYPGAEVVAENIKATTFEETLPSGTATYYYTVAASSPLGEGGVALSNSVYMGQAFTVPYSQNFDEGEESLAGFTLLNNEEGRGWFWWHNTAQNFKAMASKFNMQDACDNWMILPSIEFKASSEYKLKFSARVFSADDPEKFEVTIGAGASAQAQTRRLMSVTTIKNETEKIYEIPFKVESDGSWNISFHCVSPVKAYYLIIDDIYITETASAAGPAAVSGLAAVASEGGKMEATLNFTLPEKDYSGGKLSAISKVEIYRGADSTTPVGTLTGVTPGQKCSWTDTSAEQGDNLYRVVAFNGDARGVEASVSVYVGYDTPLPVTGAVATTDDGYNVNLRWEAPVKGVLGGDLIPSELSYRVLANDGTVLADGIKECSFTDTRYEQATTQRMVYYQIHAVYGPHESAPVLTDFIITGPDYGVPFEESFAASSLDNTPWILSTLTGNVSGCWGLGATATNIAATPYDSDEGFAYFKANELPNGISARMTSPKIDLFSADHPMISFFVYIPGKSTRETLELEITHNDHQFETLMEIPLADEEGWKQFVVEVPRIHCKEGSSIAFKATSSGYGKNICIDCITIYPSGAAEYDIDLEAVDIELPEEFMPGKEGEIVVSIYNNGQDDVEDYNVTLYCDGMAVMKTAGSKIETGQTLNYIFRATPDDSDLGMTYRYKGGVKAAGDKNSANDFTPERSVTVGASAADFIGADGMKISVKGNILTVTGASADVEVYNGAGVKVAHAVAPTSSVEVPSGMLILRSSGRSIKIMTK